jgi:DNA polymerase V
MLNILELPYYTSKVKTGFSSPANDYLHPLSTFIVESEGDSMKDAFIPPKAKLIIDRSLKPKNGDIVLAVINGEFTVKYLKKNPFKCWLIPANKKFKG